MHKHGRTIRASGPYLLKIDTDSVDVEIILEDRDDYSLTVFTDDDQYEVVRSLENAYLEGNGSAMHLRLYGPQMHGWSYNSGQAVSYGNRNGVQIGNNMTQYNNFSSGSNSVTIGNIGAVLRAPMGIRINAKSISGDIGCQDYVRTAEVDTTSGDVRFSQVDSLDARTVSGSVSATRVDERAYVRTSDGDVRLGEVGFVDIITVSSDVTIGRVNSGGGVSTTSGDVNINEARGGVYASSVSGDINAPSVGVTAKTVSGDINGRSAGGRW